jgi:hypothetical protein
MINIFLKKDFGIFLLPYNKNNGNKKMPKNADNFHCEYCDFTTSKQSNWNIHLSTRKHQKVIYGNKKMPLFVCDTCDKELANRASLCRHKKNCKAILKNELREPESEPVNEELPDVSKMINPEMVMSLLTQNQEFKATRSSC